ncbi:NAD(P)H dehydrogenase [Rhizobium mongolense]|uniref:NAD(P)H dehydrogenase n=1 Tax=Rhizobium mongolense TaxID=57676 RepID=UPI0034A1D504
MLRDRPVFIGVASGGIFTGDRANQPDFLTPYLSLALSSIGLKTQQFLPLQATAFLDWDQAPLARKKALAALDLTVVRQFRGIPGRPAGLSSSDRPYRDASCSGECRQEHSATRRKLLARPRLNPSGPAGL